MTRARNIAGFSTITTTPSPVHVGPICVLTATRIDGEFNQVDLATRNITAAGIAATNLQVSGITTGLNVSGIITAQNGINFNGTSTGLNVSGVGTIATLNVSGNATIDGNATIGGVLTYEDVTRVDSVGVVTARGLSIFGNTTGLQVASGISTFQAVTGTTGTFSAAVSGTTGTFTGIVKSGTTATGNIFSVGDGGASGDRVIQFKRAARSNDINIQAINSGTGATNLLFNQEGGAASFGGAVSATTGTFSSTISQTAPGSSTAKLTLNNASDTTGMDVGYSESSGLGFINVGQSGSGLSIKTGGTASGNERLRIDSSGRLLYGLTSSTRETSLILQGNSNSYTTNPGVLELRVGQVPSNLTSLGSVVFGCTGDKIGGTINAFADGADWSSGSSHPTAIRFYTTPTSSTTQVERVRIDKNGRLLIGTTSSTSNSFGYSWNPKIQYESISTDDYGRFSLVYNGNDGVGPGIVFGKSRGTSVGSNTVVSDGDQIGGLYFQAADGTDKNCRAATIICFSQGSSSGNDTPGKLVFSTTADTASDVTARMVIDSTGNTHFGSSGTLNSAGTVSIVPADGLINFGMDGRSSFVTSTNSAYIYSGEGSSGTTLAGDLILQSRSNQNRTIRMVTGSTPVERVRVNEYGIYVTGTGTFKAASLTSSKAGSFDPFVFDVNGNAQSTETVAIKAQKNDCLDLTRYYTAGTIQTFRFNNDFTGSIYTGTTSVTYNTSSDYRLKENAVSISDGITRLKQLKPYKFNFIKEPSVIHDGFFAHEVTPVVPTAVSGVKDATETSYYETGDVLPEGKEIGDVKEENAIVAQSLDHSKLVPLLTAALQEAIVKIETLEIQVRALQSS